MVRRTGWCFCGGSKFNGPMVPDDIVLCNLSLQDDLTAIAKDTKEACTYFLLVGP